VRAVGLEPTLCQPELDFESSASTSSATPALSAHTIGARGATRRGAELTLSATRLKQKSRRELVVPPTSRTYSAASFTGTGLE
jgi:hypothetical protein